MSGPALRTPRLVLTVLAESDRDDVVAAWAASEEHLAPWSPRRPEGWTLDHQFDAHLSRAVTGLADGTNYRFVARDADGRVAAWFALAEVVRGAFWSAYASWSVAADHVGRGLATEGTRAMLDFGFGPVGLHRVQANVIPGNVASVRVAEKLGFRLEGLARAYLRIDGRWQDHRMYAILAEEHRR